MEEVAKALGPWPILQMIFGLVILGLGVWSIMRGLKGKEENMRLEDRRQEWAAFEQLKNIEENTFKMIEHQKTVIDTQRAIVQAVNQLTSVLWNREQR